MARGRRELAGGGAPRPSGLFGRGSGRHSATTRTLRLCLALAVALFALGCRQDMHDAPRYDPLEASTFFADGLSARPIPEGTVARGQLAEDVRLHRGRAENGEPLAELPVPRTRELLLRGRQRYEIYCSPCHDSLGTGRGMIVRRGFKAPPSLHEPRLRDAPVGYLFGVMSDGFGVMSSYRKVLSAGDRWAVAAYLQALQLSQGVRLEELSPEVQRRFREAVSAASTEAEETAHGH